MADADQTIKLRVDADTSGLKKAGADATKTLDSIGASAQAASQKASTALDRASNAANDFARNSGRAAESTRAFTDQQNALQRSLDRSAEAGSRAGVILGAAVSGAAIAYGALVAHAVEAADKTHLVAQRLGLTTEALSTYHYAAQMANVSTATFDSALGRLSNAVARAAGGSKIQAQLFDKMGISVRDAGYQVKGTDTLLNEIAGKFATYRDGPEKAALANKLFGQSGSELIPLLNELGDKGFAAVREEAEKLGVVIDGNTAKAANELGNKITALKLVTEGYFNNVARDVLPNLVLFAKDLNDLADKAGVANKGTTVLGDGIRAVATWFVEGYGAAQRFGVGVGVAIDKAKIELEELKTLLTQTEFLSALAGGHLDIARTIADMMRQKFAAQQQAIDAAADQSFGEIDARVAKLVADLNKHVAAAGDGAAAAGEGFRKGTAPVFDYEGALGRASNAAQEAANALEALQNYADGLGAKVGGPVEEAWARYNAQVDRVNDLAEKALENGADLNQIFEAQNKALAAANAQRDLAIAKAQALAVANTDTGNAVDQLEQKWSDEIDSLTGLGAGYDDVKLRLQAVSEAERAYAQAVKSATTEDQVKALKDSHDALIENANAYATARIAAKEYADTIGPLVQLVQQAGESIADAFAKAVVEGGSLMKSLANIAKQVVEQIIAYFAKLAVINPILNSIFGAVGGSLLPTLAGAATSGIAGEAAGAAAGGQFNIMQPATWLAAGKSLWGGFSGAMQSFWSGSAYNPASVNFVGPPVAGQTFGPQYGGYGSGFGQALGIGASIYAGYNRFQSAGGGVAGLAGGAAYGAGTYVLGAGLSSAAAGTGFAAGLGALGPIGWVALAAMLIDKFSGGKLFGTEGKVIGGGSTFDVTSTGVDLSQHYTTKGQKPLFGGATFDEHDMAPTQEAIDAANQFFESLKTGTANFAKQFGVTMGDIVGGTFEQTFDKNGKVTGSTTTIAGHTYSGESQDQFTERLQSENMLAVLGQFDSGLNAAVDQFRADADTLAKVTGQLANAESMMQAGTKFLALGSDQSLSSLLKLAEGAQQFGETIDQTLQRIEQAQQAYDQFVAQFKPAGMYVDDFEGAMAQLRSQFQANIDQANALAKAAGAAGASTEDLANITQWAAQQQAALIAQLQASAQDLAFSLGLTTTGSLDAVNQEIQRLQAEAGTGSNALRGFGDAVNSVAEAAQSAAQLMLGDLSPLNDTQKLQYALDAFHRGAASTEDVLQVAARLWTTSSTQYQNLFNQLQGATPTAATAAVSASQGGLSGADAARLQQLLQEQATLQAAQTQAQYKTLAQQIAEIASATGEDWQKVLSDMGVNASDLEKGLGLANDDALSQYLGAIQTQTDSNGDNTTSIIAAIHDIGDQITAAITSAPPQPDDSGVVQTNTILAQTRDLLTQIFTATQTGNTDNADALAEVAGALGTMNDTLARGVANGTLVARR